MTKVVHDKYTDLCSPDGLLVGREFDPGEFTRISNFYTLVFLRSTRCVCCGVKGTYYKQEPNETGSFMDYHLNLFSVDPITGDSILMTKDHIQPHSLNGSNELYNLVTCCRECNMLKANNLLSWVELRQLILAGDFSFCNESDLYFDPEVVRRRMLYINQETN